MGIQVSARPFPITDSQSAETRRGGFRRRNRAAFDGQSFLDQYRLLVRFWAKCSYLVSSKGLSEKSESEECRTLAEPQVRRGKFAKRSPSPAGQTFFIQYLGWRLGQQISVSHEVEEQNPDTTQVCPSMDDWTSVLSKVGSAGASLPRSQCLVRSRSLALRAVLCTGYPKRSQRLVFARLARSGLRFTQAIPRVASVRSRSLALRAALRTGYPKRSRRLVFPPFGILPFRKPFGLRCAPPPGLGCSSP